MRLRLFLLALCSIVLSICTDAQTWQWAQIEPQILSGRTNVAADAQGNIYQTGAIFNSGIFQGSVITQPGTWPNNTAGFIIKRDAAGTVLWTKVFPKLNFSDLKSDPAGNLVAIVEFSLPVVVGTQTITPIRNPVFMVMKFDNNGNYLWHQQIACNGQIMGEKLAVDTANANNVYVAFNTAGDSSIIGQYSVSTMLNPNSVYKIGVLKFDASGNLLWNYFANDVNFAMMYDVAVDNAGSCVVAGIFYSNLVFPTTTLQSAGAADAYAFKLNAGGNLIWTKKYGGTGGDALRTVHFDNTNNVYLCGTFSGTNVVVGNSVLSTSVGADAFIVKCNSGGTEIWEKQIGNASLSEFPIDAVGYAGGAFYAIWFNGSSINLGGNTYTLNSTSDPIGILHYDNNGNFLNLATIDGGGFYWGGNMNVLSLDNKCGLCITATSSSLQTLAFGSTVLTASVSGTSYIAKLYLPINQASVNITGSYSACIGTSISLQAAGATSYTWSTGANSSAINLPVYTNTFVSLTATAVGLPCPVQLLRSITALPLPSVTINSSATLVCEASAVTLTATGAQSYTWNTGSNSFSIVVTPTTNSIYYVNASNANCAATQSVLIQTKAAPALQIATTPTVICAGETLQVAASGANTYTWSTGSNSPSISLANANNTVLTVSGTNTLTACSNTIAMQINVNACLGIENTSSNNKAFTFYPNPADKTITINSNSACQISIFDVQGRLVLNSELSGNQLLNISGLESGLYLLKSSDSTHFAKIIIQH